jgi:hypothetical protein
MFHLNEPNSKYETIQKFFFAIFRSRIERELEKNVFYRSAATKGFFLAKRFVRANCILPNFLLSIKTEANRDCLPWTSKPIIWPLFEIKKSMSGFLESEKKNYNVSSSLRCESLLQALARLQGDQIGRIFIRPMCDCLLWKIFKNDISTPFFFGGGLLFPRLSICIKFDKKMGWARYALGDFFRKLTWSPCSASTYKRTKQAVGKVELGI